MRTLTIRTQRPYNALIAPGLLDRAGQEIARVLSPCRAVLVTDDTVDALYGDKVLESLHRAGFDAAKFTFPPGEESKNMQTYQQLIWPNYWPNSGLNEEQRTAAEAYITREINKVSKPYMGNTAEEYKFTLPWSRMFEVKVER